MALWLVWLSEFATGCLDRTCVHESVVKIQVVQIRRVLLLFALVLGLSALVASIAPPPDDEEAPAPATPAEAGVPLLKPDLALRVRRPGARPLTRRVKADSSFSLTVRVPKAGDVVLEGLGPRQTADPLTPARFELLASPPGRHAVTFVPVDGPRRVVGRLVFVDAATVTPRRRDR